MTDTTQIDLSRAEGVTLSHGSHASREHGMCVMELVAFVAGEPHGDFPGCVPREISRLAQRVNDAPIWDSDAQRTEALRPLIPLMLRAAHGPEARRRRAYLAAHFAAQRAADALDSIGKTEAAAKLRAITAPTSGDECLALRSAALEARDAAAAYAAAAAAAYAAADAHADADAAAYAADAAAYAYAADAAKTSRQKLSGEPSSVTRREARRAALLHLLRAFCEVTP
jgi:hypothetical protein